MTHSKNTKSKLVEKLYQEGQKLARESKHEDAISYFDKVLEQHPTNTDAFYSKGLRLIELGKHKKAFLCFDEIFRFDPNSDYDCNFTLIK